MSAPADSADQRNAIFAALERRNRVVAILRIGLPLLGALVLAALLLQIVVSSVLNQFGISGITIDRGNLVVETPSYSGMSANGAMYTISSEGARTSLDAMDAIILTGAVLSVSTAPDASMTARAAEARFQTTDQLVSVAGVTEISGSNGMTGTVLGMRADMVSEKMTSDGPADIRFKNGATLTSATVSYDAKAETWTFYKAKLYLPETPGDVPVPEAGQSPATEPQP